MSDSALSLQVLLEGDDEYLLSACEYLSGWTFPHLFVRTASRTISWCYGTTPYDLVYDVGSLTKPLVVGLLTALAYESSELSLDSTVGHFIKEGIHPAFQALTIRALATHTTRIRAWLPLFLLSNRAPLFSEDTPYFDYSLEPRTVVYSDSNFIILGQVLESLYQTSLYNAFTQLICSPLRLSASTFSPSATTLCAPTEKGRITERDMAVPYVKDYAEERILGLWCSPRETPLCGEVHDANAAFLGGCTGSAGLFSTPREVVELLEQYSVRSVLLSPSTRALFTLNHTNYSPNHRGISLHLASSLDSSVGYSLTPSSFGHFAWIGPSVWHDPQREVTISFCGVRSFPPRDLYPFRKALHKAVLQFLSEEQVI
jgi:serine-type D-Ala-D-Ala carboxypeptidase